MYTHSTRTVLHVLVQQYLDSEIFGWVKTIHIAMASGYLNPEGASPECRAANRPKRSSRRFDACSYAPGGRPDWQNMKVEFLKG